MVRILSDFNSKKSSLKIHEHKSVHFIFSSKKHYRNTNDSQTLKCRKLCKQVSLSIFMFDTRASLFVTLIAHC